MRDSRWVRRLGVLSWCALILTGAPSSRASDDGALSGKLASVLSRLPHKQAVVGACVIDLATGRTVFTRNADTPLIPASTMKVYAMASALVHLGPEFEFETVLATDGVDLVVVGDGDPAFGDEKLCRLRDETVATVFEQWADLLRARGMASFPGDLVIDESVFDRQRVHPSWEAGDLGKWYAAPVGGLNINDNCLDITAVPSGKAGSPVRVELQPVNSVAIIRNKCRSGGKHKAILHHPPGGLEYILSGRCTKPWRFGPVAFPDPGLLFADSLVTILKGKGVTIEGGLRRERVRLPDGTLPERYVVLARHRTPIADVLGRTGKNSQNLFAECLLKRSAYAWSRKRGGEDAKVGGPGTWPLGGQLARDVVREAGIDVTGLVIDDGSGLSRNNRCTARQLAEMVAWLDRHESADLFREALSVSGVDGSLGKRLKDLTGRVRGKTGTMRGVRALCGYVDARVGSGAGGYAFAVLFNGYKGPSTPYREIQDRFCRALASTTPVARTGR